MTKSNKVFKIIFTITMVMIVIGAFGVNAFAGVIWDTDALGKFNNTNFDYAIAPLDNVSIQFSAGNNNGGYDSPYVYDITPTTFIPLDYWEEYNNVAKGQITDNYALDNDSIKYNSNVVIKPRTFTDWYEAPYNDYNAIEYTFNFNPISIDKSDEFGTPTAVANNFYIRMSQIFIDLSENNDRQPYHYMVSTQTSANNLEYAFMQVSYDVVVPYTEADELGNTFFGFKKVKTVTRADQINANTGYPIIKDTDFTKEEIISAIGYDGASFIDESPIMITNISINLYTRCSYFAGSAPIFKYTVSTPEYPDYILSNNYDNWLIDIPQHNIIDFENISWVDWFTTQVQSLLSIELGLGLTIGVILFFVISVALMFFFLKMFAGG